MKDNTKREVITYTLAALMVSSGICVLAYTQANANLALLTVLSPTVLALIFSLVSGGSRSAKSLFVGQTFRTIPLPWLAASVLTIPVLAWVALLLSHSLDFSALQLRTTRLLPQVIVILVIALGEEYGWRGYLLPRLLRLTSPLRASVILGFIWGVWHFPAYLIGTGVPDNMSFVAFMVWVLLATVLMTWIYLHTRSVVTAILLHASANMTFNYWWLLPEFTGTQRVFNVMLILLAAVVIAVVVSDRKMHAGGSPEYTRDSL